MNDVTFSGTLDSAKLIARAVDDKTIRRVQWRFSGEFSVELAEWLGDDASEMRRMMIKGQLAKFTLPIDAYAARASMGGSGNADATVFGVSAAAKMAGPEDAREPVLDLTFEAPPQAALLTWLAASLKHTCSVDLKVVQLELALDEADGVRAAIEKFRETIPKGTTVTMHMEGDDGASFEGTGEARE